jgi:pimeloyl-ACP methyl ester carboxylesterase
MTALRNSAAASRHTPAIEEVYRRMLRDADAQGRFVRRSSGIRVHVVAAGDGPTVVHLHGTNTSSLSHLMLPGRAPGIRSYLVDRPGCGLSDPDPFRRRPCPGGRRLSHCGLLPLLPSGTSWCWQ